MRNSLALILLGLLVAAPSAAQQTIPGVNTPFGGLARQLAGIEFIKAEIADLRRELSGCDGAGVGRTGNCASRALLQAKLNYLLEVSLMLGDPDSAGAPPKPAEKPTDASNYEAEFSYLREQLAQEPPGGYIISENRARYLIIGHCKAMKDHSTLMALQTDEETRASIEDERTGKTKANVSACIKEYDAKAIAANHKIAFEYCVPATIEKDGTRPLLNLCMHKHDMLTAMCKQQVDFMTAMQQHKNPQGQHAWAVCPSDRLSIGPSELQAIMAAPPVRTMAELAPKFFAPPDVVIPPRTPLPIPPGTTIEVKIQGSWDGLAIDRLANDGSIIPTILDQPLVVGGKEVLAAFSSVILKGRVIGPGAGPDTVRIGLTTDEVNVPPRGNYADLKSNELVFTVPYHRTATNVGIQFDTRLRFTIGQNGSVETPSAQTPTTAGPRGPARPPLTAPPPQAPTAPAPATSTPQQQAEEARKRAERVQACVQQAIRDNPTGSLALSTAIAACAQTK